MKKSDSSAEKEKCFQICEIGLISQADFFNGKCNLIEELSNNPFRNRKMGFTPFVSSIEFGILFDVLFGIGLLGGV